MNDLISRTSGFSNSEIVEVASLFGWTLVGMLIGAAGIAALFATGFTLRDRLLGGTRRARAS